MKERDAGYTQFSCPHCGKAIRLKEEFAGRQGACPHCKKPMQAPATAPPPRRPAPEPEYVVVDDDYVVVDDSELPERKHPDGMKRKTGRNRSHRTPRSDDARSIRLGLILRRGAARAGALQFFHWFALAMLAVGGVLALAMPRWLAPWGWVSVLCGMVPLFWGALKYAAELEVVQIRRVLPVFLRIPWTILSLLVVFPIYLILELNQSWKYIFFLTLGAAMVFLGRTLVPPGAW